MDAPHKNIPPKFRRRLSDFARTALGTYLAAEDPEDSELIFASRYSDMQETLKLLTELNQQELLSPTAFSTSVHNAVPGFATLIRTLRSAHSGISAGVDSFTMGLTEALTRISYNPARAVTYLFHEAALPDEYRPLAPEGSDGFTLCVSLSSRPTALHDRALALSRVKPEKTHEQPNGLNNARAFVRLLGNETTEVRLTETRRNLLVRRADA
ncbi:beta-ketoacyl synthase chain length factor [Ruegeria sp. MALMAid1280]|uniref:beta-ketoacyl synthase chain length factor n=1 Tax=Ruegeria sp. MALMAid1280 TaxID=3411634 RepID=UPI003BA273F6